MKWEIQVNDKSNIILNNTICLILFSISIIIIVDASSILAYILTFFYIIFFTKILRIKNNLFSPILCYHFYLFFAIIIYIWQKLLFPSDLGLSGQAEGGADDVIYYSTFRNLNTPYFCSWAGEGYSIVSLIEFLYPFRIYSPLNVIIVNLIGCSFLPVYTFLLAEKLFFSKIIAKRSAILILWCPFIIYYGCILLRDVIVVTTVVASLYYYLDNRKIWFAIFFCLTIFLRLGSLVFIIAPIIVDIVFNIQDKFKNKSIGLIIAVSVFSVCLVFLLAISFSYLQEITNGKLEDGLVRSSFANKLMLMDSNAVIVKLLLLPIPLNILSLTIFFLFTPFLTWPSIWYPLPIFTKFLTPIYFLIILIPFLRGFLLGIRNKSKSANYLVWTILIMAFLLGTISLQVRHKTVMFPFIAILSAYGYNIKSLSIITNSLIVVFAVLLIFVEILIAK